MERYDDARATWAEALELSHDVPDSSPLEIGLTHHAIAEAHRHQGNYEEAERIFHEALKHYAPRSVHSAETWRALGQTLHAADRPDDAIEALTNALDAEKAQPQRVNARLVTTLQLLASVGLHGPRSATGHVCGYAAHAGPALL
jgi:tetratricopeptide (TPR) repeat protein